jgi:tetratricopeptide (TPR) repeat protein
MANNSTSSAKTKVIHAGFLLADPDTQPKSEQSILIEGEPATQNNLGGALRALGVRESGTVRLEEAVTACRAALEERTRERVPLDWAATQNNLGGALQALGAREHGTARLEEAVAVHGAALEEWTRERAPLEWAKGTGNQGVVLMLLAERCGDSTAARTAVRQIEVAYIALQGGGNVSASAHFKAQLSKAQALLDRLTSR